MGDAGKGSQLTPAMVQLVRSGVSLPRGQRQLCDSLLHKFLFRPRLSKISRTSFEVPRAKVFDAGKLHAKISGKVRSTLERPVLVACPVKAMRVLNRTDRYQLRCYVDPRRIARCLAGMITALPPLRSTNKDDPRQGHTQEEAI